MLKIYYKQVYKTDEISRKQHVLILYDISANHYVGVPIYSLKKDNYLYLKSINKYVDVNQVSDYNRSKIYECIYVKGKPLKISNKDYNNLLLECRGAILDFLNNNVSNDNDGFRYLKWCRDKYKIGFNEESLFILKQNAIYWVDFGVNVGSELRKLRPAILWRSTSDKKVWTMIPLTTKKREDKYYFHYDLECISEGTAKIENMMNYSFKRIVSPYFSRNKLAILSNNDYNEIRKRIMKYYLFGKE